MRPQLKPWQMSENESNSIWAWHNKLWSYHFSARNWKVNWKVSESRLSKQQHNWLEPNTRLVNFDDQRGFLTDMQISINRTVIRIVTGYNIHPAWHSLLPLNTQSWAADDSRLFSAFFASLLHGLNNCQTTNNWILQPILFVCLLVCFTEMISSLLW